MTEPNPVSAEPKSEWKIKLLLSLLLISSIAALYRPLSHADFINMDDPDYVWENPRVMTGLTWPNFRWAFQIGYASNWHPLTWLSHMLDCQLFGVNPGPIHLVNVGFHCANAVLLFLIFARMTGLVWPSWLVAVLFAIHPLHVQSVAWISERKDVLSSFFSLLAMAAYVGYAARKDGRKRWWPWYVLVLMLFALALLSKPMPVTLPFVFLLLDFWPLRRMKVRSDGGLYSLPLLLLEKAPFFIMSALTCYITTLAQTKAMAGIVPLGERLRNAAYSYVCYLDKTVWPANLAAYYPYVRIWAWWEAPGAILVLVLLSVLVLRLARRRPYLLCGWLWFLGMLIPMIGLVQVGAASMADRYTYLPLIGIFFAAVWWGYDAIHGWYRRLIQAGLVLVMASFAWCSHYQIAYWDNTIDLFQHALSVTRWNYYAHTCLGGGYSAKHFYRLASIQYEKALALVPFDPGSNLNCGKNFAAQKKYDEALHYFRKAIEYEPEFAEAHFNLANCLGVLGRFSEATEQYRAALAYQPDFPDILVNYATVLALQNNLDEAAAEYEKALALFPNNPQTHFLLGTILARQAKWALAIEQYRAAVRLDPSNPEPMNDLAWILATTPVPHLQNRPEAVTLAEKTCALSGFTNVSYLDTMAVAYAKVGRFNDAIQLTQKARALAQTNHQTTLVSIMDKRLVEYASGHVDQPVVSVPALSPRNILGVGDKTGTAWKSAHPSP